MSDEKPPTPPTPPPPPPPQHVVPYDRFAEVVAEKNTYKAAADAAASTAAELAAERAARAADRAAWADEKALMQRGLTDPEGIEIAKHLHGRLPEEGRPKLADWVGGFSADASKAPIALRGYLGQPTAPPAPPPKVPPGSGSVTPDAPPVGGEVTPAQIIAAREHGVKTGDWSQYRSLRPQLGLAPPPKP